MSTHKQQVFLSYSRTPLKISGNFYLQGPWEVIGREEGAPQWVANVFEQNPEIEKIAVNFKKGGEKGVEVGGVCYERMTKEPKVSFSMPEMIKELCNHSQENFEQNGEFIFVCKICGQKHLILP